MGKFLYREGEDIRNFLFSLTFISIPVRLRARYTEGAHEKSLAAQDALWYNALRLQTGSLPFPPT